MKLETENFKIELTRGIGYEIKGKITRKSSGEFEKRRYSLHEQKFIGSFDMLSREEVYEIEDRVEQAFHSIISDVLDRD